MYKVLTSVLLCLCAVNSAFGATVSDSVKKAWMTGSYGTCGSNAALAGAMNTNTGTENKGNVYWVAWELNANGGKFCPTQMGAKRSGGGKPWTVFYNISKDSDCIWLCKNGKGGDKCNSNVTEISGVEQILQKTDGKNSDNVNVEDSIAKLINDFYKDCSSKSYKPYHSTKDQEHSVVLAVTGYTSDGYGAYVQPLTLRAAARRTGSYWHDYNKAFAFAYLANSGDKTLVCMNGYKHNANGNGCVKYTAAQVAKEEAVAKAKEEAAKACDGWVISTTDEFLATYKVIESGGCNQYRCKNASKGFKDDTDKTCVACSDDDQHGVNPETGVCVTCTAKQTFSKDAKETGYCREKTMLTPAHLQYGVKNTQSLKLEQQCWYILHKEGFDKYKECIVAQSHGDEK